MERAGEKRGIGEGVEEGKLSELKRKIGLEAQFSSNEQKRF